MELPVWLTEQNKEDGAGNRPKTGFLRKTMANISHIFREELLAERFVSNRGLLQGLDPRVKLISLLLLMVCAGLAKSIFTLVLLAFLAFMLLKLSKLEALPYIRRVWLILPVLILLLSVPAATNLIIPGKPLLFVYRNVDTRTIFHWLPQELYVSSQGAAAVIKMSLRAGCSLSFGYLLFMTTRWSHVTRSLSLLHVPTLMITVLDMTYRYIFVLCGTAVEMFEARFLRTVGKIGNRDSRRFVSGSIAMLFLKSAHMGEEIYNAMVSRGYTGESVCLEKFRFTRNDAVWLVNLVSVLIILWLGEFVVAR